MKQSSIEWLFEQYELVGMLTTAQVQKAKAMHKEEIRKAYWNGEYYKEKKLTIEYYDETFNSKWK